MVLTDSLKISLVSLINMEAETDFCTSNRFQSVSDFFSYTQNAPLKRKKNNN